MNALSVPSAELIGRDDLVWEHRGHVFETGHA